MQIDWKSPNAIIAYCLMVFGIAVFMLVLLRGLGGEQAVFLILGYISGWIGSIVLFFFRKSPPSK